MGPERVKQTIKEALAKGADRGIHITDDKFCQLDPLGSATSLAAAIKKEKFDLVLTGLQSDDQASARRRTARRASGSSARDHHHAIEVPRRTHESEA